MRSLLAIAARLGSVGVAQLLPESERVEIEGSTFFAAMKVYMSTRPNICINTDSVRWYCLGMFGVGDCAERRKNYFLFVTARCLVLPVRRRFVL
jgi:hypothetical protein